MANKISVIIEATTDRAIQSVGNFRKSIQDADGVVGKFKATTTGAFNFAKANAGEFALAAGAALVGFGVRAVSAFQDTALEAGALRDKLGLTADEASRFIEVAGDMGIEVGALEATIGRMNREADGSPAKFDAIGASIVRNKDGTLNVKDTFLSVVDALNRIPDAARRAQAGQEIFGRSWMGIAEMVGQGAEGIERALESVEIGKVITDEEVDQARAYRDALDTLKGTVEELTIEIGGFLVPKLTEAAEALGEIRSVASELTGIIPGPLKDGFRLLGDQVQRSLFWPKYILDFKGALTDTKETVGTLGASITEYSEDAESDLADVARMYADHSRGMQREAEETAAANEAATRRIEAAWDLLNQELSDRSAYLDIQDALAGVEASYLTAMDTADKSLSEQEADARAVERSVLDLKGKVNAYAEDVALLPPEVATELQTLIDEGAYAEVERRLGVLERIRIAIITPQTGRAYGGVPDQTPGAKFHSGGIAGVGNFASNEVPAVLQKGEMVLTKGQQAAVASQLAGGASGGTTNVTINVNGGDPNTVVAALRKYVRTNGPITGIT